MLEYLNAFLNVTSRSYARFSIVVLSGASFPYRSCAESIFTSKIIVLFLSIKSEESMLLVSLIMGSHRLMKFSGESIKKNRQELFFVVRVL